MPRRAAIIIMACAVLASFLVARAFGLKTEAAAEIVALAAGSAGAIGMLGAALLHLARGRTIRVQTVIATLTSVLSVIGAMAAASSAMFSASSEAGALAAILIVSGTLGVLIALALGVRAETDRSMVIEATRQAARGDAVSIEASATEEFGDVAQEIKAMAAQRDEALARERSLDRSRRELVAWVSHDLRTPLARVRAVVEALEDRISDDAETNASYYRTLDSETKRLSKLIDDLLELSRISAGALELELESLSIADLVSDVVASTHELAERKGVTVSLRVDVRPRVRISPTHIERALGNLIDNAVRHSERGSDVTIGISAATDFVHIEVIDNGGGLPPAELARLDDQSRPALPEDPPPAGRGLGLAIARGLVEAHSGSISATNSGAGCCITIALPLSTVDGEPSQDPAEKR